MVAPSSLDGREWDFTPRRLRMDDGQQDFSLGRASYRDLKEENDELRIACHSLRKNEERVTRELEQMQRRYNELQEEMIFWRSQRRNQDRDAEHIPEPLDMQKEIVTSQAQVLVSPNKSYNFNPAHSKRFNGEFEMHRSVVTWLRDVEAQCKLQHVPVVNWCAVAASLFGDEVTNWTESLPEDDKAVITAEHGDWTTFKILMAKAWLSAAKVESLVEFQRKIVRQSAKEKISSYIAKFRKYANHIIGCYKLIQKQVVTTAFLNKMFIVGTHHHVIRVRLKEKLRIALERDGLTEEYCSIESIGKHLYHIYTWAESFDDGEGGTEGAKLHVIQVQSKPTPSLPSSVKLADASDSAETKFD